MPNTTARRNGKNYCWVTWLTGLLAGDDSCQYAAWYRAHFTFVKVERAFDLAAWKASHAAMVEARAAELRAEGWTVRIEDQNKFRLEGRTLIIGGKPDIAAFKDDQVLVVDCKGGKVRASDYWQVLVYLYALPKLEPEGLLPARTYRGEVCYSTHRIPIEPEELSADKRQRIESTARTVGAEDRPYKVPSGRECGFCDLSQNDCPERMAPVEQVAMVDAF